MLQQFLALVFCHLVGDYVLQNDFIAKTKGTNMYHMWVHVVLYALPFYLLYGDSWGVALIIFTHVIIDLMKAKYNKISYATDQILHYIVLVVFLVIEYLK